MSSKKAKYYFCIHNSCAFKTDKRKAIVTHLLRTHNERKEDYECEYCDKLFGEEKEIENHLRSKHPGHTFRYTCVSRIENVVNQCAKAAAEQYQQTNTQTVSQNPSHASPVVSKPNRHSSPKPKQVEVKLEPKKTPPRIAKTNRLSTAHLTDTLSDSAALPKISVPKNPYTLVKQEPLDPEDDEDDGDDDFVAPSRSYQVKSPTNKPSLRVKLTVKNPSKSPASVSSPTETSPSVTPTRQKGQKYFDKLEVYHFIDELGQRCCPFCPYRTTKNTIRVHLAGKHKIFFVKCSLCDYKAAFPHQVSQHGVRFHHTTDFEIVHLTKEYREEVISKLPTSMELEEEVGGTTSPTATQAASKEEEDCDIEDEEEDEDFISDEDVSVSEDEDIPTMDNRVFKAPKCQTSKTPYYSIHYENAQYIYKCSICPFQTPVRATIYTHKYRHEGKAFKCSYCDYQSSPRSTVVFHIRSKHKGLPIEVMPADADLSPDRSPAQHNNTDEMTYSEGNQDADYETALENQAIQEVKQEPMETDDESSIYSKPVQNSLPLANTKSVPKKTIIKVPQFKRNLTTVARNPVISKPVTSKPSESNQSSYKMSTNRLYRVNPNRTPKFLCNKCPYAADTHPKMKHHLYRHRPQQYKCPYCSHRKYPRSYVVRHVRSTHPEKPLKVIDLLKTGKVIDVDRDPDDDDEEEEYEGDNEGWSYSPSATRLDQDSAASSDSNSETTVKQEVIDQDMVAEEEETSLKKKPVQPRTKISSREYTINTKTSPRYTCNLCSYGTENYKTIHTHMYRHESNQFQCVYCNFRKSPRSSVEAHIKVMHKGLPVQVKDLRSLPARNQQQRHSDSQKRKQSINKPDSSREAKKLRMEETQLSQSSPVNKLSIRWPAPKPASTVGKAVSKSGSSSLTQQPLKPSSAKSGGQRTSSNSKRSPSPSTNKTPNSNKSNSGQGNRSTFKTMYKCVFDSDICKHISKDKSKMKQHLFHHVEYKPWSCDLCDMTATQSSHVKNHIRQEHPGTSEMAFKYKRHNYLEKHIEGFIQKGMFTVPISEYHVILEMKGTSKKSHMTFEMDSRGYFLCPYCDYKTRGEGMYDHVKMKHRQPRYKCHWCDFKAFYRSEVRKHHRRESSHAELEFHTDELDIQQMAEEYREGIGDFAQIHRHGNSEEGMEVYDDEGDLSDEDEEEEEQGEFSYNEVDRLDSGQFEYLSQEDIQTFQLDEAPVQHSHWEQGTQLHQASDSQSNTSNSEKLFQCGYCNFSAKLRIRVKMHCQKKHSDQKVYVIDPNTTQPVLLTSSEIKKEPRSTNEGIVVNLPGEKVSSGISLKIPDFLSGRSQFEEELKAAGVSTLNLQSLSPEKLQELSRGKGHQSQEMNCIGGARKRLDLHEKNTDTESVVVKTEPMDQEEYDRQEPAADSEFCTEGSKPGITEEDNSIDSPSAENDISQDSLLVGELVDDDGNQIKILSSVSLADMQDENNSQCEERKLDESINIPAREKNELEHDQKEIVSAELCGTVAIEKEIVSARQIDDKSEAGKTPVWMTTENVSSVAFKGSEPQPNVLLVSGDMSKSPEGELIQDEESSSEVTKPLDSLSGKSVQENVSTTSSSAPCPVFESVRTSEGSKDVHCEGLENTDTGETEAGAGDSSQISKGTDNSDSDRSVQDVLQMKQNAKSGPANDEEQKRNGTVNQTEKDHSAGDSGTLADDFSKLKDTDAHVNVSQEEENSASHPATVDSDLDYHGKDTGPDDDAKTCHINGQTT